MSRDPIDLTHTAIQQMAERLREGNKRGVFREAADMLEALSLEREIYLHGCDCDPESACRFAAERDVAEVKLREAETSRLLLEDDLRHAQLFEKANRERAEMAEAKISRVTAGRFKTPLHLEPGEAPEPDTILDARNKPVSLEWLCEQINAIATGGQS